MRGTDGTLMLCENSPATGLFAELGGTPPDAGGSWTVRTGTRSGSFDPASIRWECTPTRFGRSLCPTSGAR